MLKSGFSGSWLTKLTPVDFGASSSNSGVDEEDAEVFSPLQAHNTSALAPTRRPIWPPRRSFIRILRIERITRIAPLGVTGLPGGPGFFGNCRSGCITRASELYEEITTRKIRVIRSIRFIRS